MTHLEPRARPAASPAWRARVLRVSMFNLVRGLRLANSVDIHLLAQKTIGMVGRDLANAVDEAASAGRRRCQPIIELEDFVEAIDRIRLGFDKKDWGDGNEEYPACVPERISL